jgi:subtilisin family serine protease
MAKAKSQLTTAKFRRTTKVVPNEYIVVLKDNIAGEEVSSIAASLSRAHRGIVMHTYKYALKGFAVRMPEQAAISLSQNPQVEFVEENGEGKAAQVIQGPPTPWGLERIDQIGPVGAVARFPPGPDEGPTGGTSGGTFTYTNTGSGVHVYVIDTGIMPSHEEFQDPELGGRASVLFDAIDDDNNPATDSNTDGNGLDGVDCSGHGTSVASVIAGKTYGVAKKAIIHMVRAIPCTTNYKISDALRAVDAVTLDARNRPGMEVVNMSLAYSDNKAYEGDPTTLETAIATSMTWGLTYVVGAGNGNDSVGKDVDAYHVSPARIPEVITVGATSWETLSSAPTPLDTKLWYSNFGPKVDIFAPGRAIPVAGIANNSQRLVKSGTSMAAPHVAGVVALYLQSQTLPISSRIVGQMIKSNAVFGGDSFFPGLVGSTDYSPTTPTTKKILNANFVLPYRSNPINNAGLFTWYHYLDFFGCNREPDDAGLEYWRSQITQCGSDTTCVGNKRVDVGRAFFYSPEFIQDKPLLAASNRGTQSYNEEFVRQCYLVYLRRAPDQAGYNNWLGVLNSYGFPTPAEGYNHLIRAFIVSPEYLERFETNTVLGTCGQ